MELTKQNHEAIFNEDEFKNLLDDFEFVKNSKKIEYCNVPFSFDIETSSFYQNDEKKAIMYAFCFGVNGKVVLYRTWDDFIKILHCLHDYYNLSNEKRIIVYVHNLAYEFQFFRKRLNIVDIFASENRKPIKVLTDLGIEFRCSYIESGYNLENLGKNLTKYKVNKLVGDLDYRLIRHNKTELSPKEEQYIINDVLVVMAHIQEQIENYGDILKLQLTKTGYVRKYLRDCCLYDGNHKKNGYKYIKYMKFMNMCKITSELEYDMLERASSGGFTHCNGLYNNVIIEDVYSVDECSAYPYAMLSELFPVSSAKLIKSFTSKEFYTYLKTHCCIFNITFYNLKTRENRYEHILSYSRCFNVKNDVCDNGRIVECEMCSSTITNVDFDMMKNFYTWDKIEIWNLHIYRKGYLPKDFIKGVIELIYKKTTLKGVEGEEVNYMQSKQNLNASFGMALTKIIQNDIKYVNDEWIENEVISSEQLEKYNNSKNRFLFFPWGVFITAYARRNLQLGIIELGRDYLYTDTDSLKFRNYEAHRLYFENYNKLCYKKLEKMCNFYHLDINECNPKNIKGETKYLGAFEYEGHYKYFKTLGAKRYIYVDDNNDMHITIAGVSKNNGLIYLKHKYKDNLNILKNFTNNLYFPKNFEISSNELNNILGKEKSEKNEKLLMSATGKNIHTYVDDEIYGTIVDYKGIKNKYYEDSFIHLEECDYSLSLSHEYVNYLLNIEEFTR